MWVKLMSALIKFERGLSSEDQDNFLELRWEVMDYVDFMGKEIYWKECVIKELKSLICDKMGS